jgi:hypothetical protein
MTLDLATLDTVAACDAGAEIELRHPVTKAPLGIYISGKGKDSAAWRAEVHKSVNARIKRRGAVSTPEEAEVSNIMSLVAVTISWRSKNDDGKTYRNTITFEKKELDCTPENAKLLYTRLIWMRDQFDEGLADLANFLAP